jgi:hypothetical protein
MDWEAIDRAAQAKIAEKHFDWKTLNPKKRQELVEYYIGPPSGIVIPPASARPTANATQELAANSVGSPGVKARQSRPGSSSCIATAHAHPPSNHHSTTRPIAVFPPVRERRLSSVPTTLWTGNLSSTKAQWEKFTEKFGDDASDDSSGSSSSSERDDQPVIVQGSVQETFADPLASTSPNDRSVGAVCSVPGLEHERLKSDNPEQHEDSGLVESDKVDEDTEMSNAEASNCEEGSLGPHDLPGTSHGDADAISSEGDEAPAVNDAAPILTEEDEIPQVGEEVSGAGEVSNVDCEDRWSGAGSAAAPVDMEQALWSDQPESQEPQTTTSIVGSVGDHQQTALEDGSPLESLQEDLGPQSRDEAINSDIGDNDGGDDGAHEMTPMAVMETTAAQDFDRPSSIAGTRHVLPTTSTAANSPPKASSLSSRDRGGLTYGHSPDWLPTDSGRDAMDGDDDLYEEVAKIAEQVLSFTRPLPAGEPFTAPISAPGSLPSVRVTKDCSDRDSPAVLRTSSDSVLGSTAGVPDVGALSDASSLLPCSAHQITSSQTNREMLESADETESDASDHVDPTTPAPSAVQQAIAIATSGSSPPCIPTTAQKRKMTGTSSKHFSASARRLHVRVSRSPTATPIKHSTGMNNTSSDARAEQLGVDVRARTNNERSQPQTYRYTPTRIAYVDLGLHRRPGPSGLDVTTSPMNGKDSVQQTTSDHGHRTRSPVQKEKLEDDLLVDSHNGSAASAIDLGQRGQPEPMGNREITADGDETAQEQSLEVEPTVQPSAVKRKTATRKTGTISEHFIGDRVDLYNTTAGKRRRVAAGESANPFPPIDKPYFGIIQERTWHEPFWLIIATVFLNKTTGRQAAPTFWKIRQRWPKPYMLAQADYAELFGMIEHLGLQNQRTKRIIQLAHAWTTHPPVAGERHRKLHYPAKGDGKQWKKDEVVVEDADDCAGALEIAHLPGCGAYAYDSWRIFCRDVLRGIATDYRGTNAKVPGFEPEWKRVLPADKELRACLRWMWLKEGIVWDPLTGAKRAATDLEMDRARRGDFELEDEAEQMFAAHAAAVDVDSPQRAVRGDAALDDTPVKEAVVAQGSASRDPAPPRPPLDRDDFDWALRDSQSEPVEGPLGSQLAGEDAVRALDNSVGRPSSSESRRGAGVLALLPPTSRSAMRKRKRRRSSSGKEVVPPAGPGPERSSWKLPVDEMFGVDDQVTIGSKAKKVKKTTEQGSRTTKSTADRWTSARLVTGTGLKLDLLHED